MNHLRRRRWPTWAFLACWLPIATQTQPSNQPIRNIQLQHIGPPAASDQLIRAHIQTQTGKPINHNQINQDIKTLLNTGYFHNINITSQTNPDDNTLTLTYTLQAKPTLTQINITGNTHIKTKRLLKQTTSQTGKPLDEQQLFKDTQAIQKHYENKGYRGTTIHYTTNIDEPRAQGTATFHITETPKIRIQAVNFPNTQAFTTKKLRKTIKTRNRWLLSWLTGSGTLKQDQLLQDQQKLQNLYHQHGYLDFNIQNIQHQYPKPNRLILNIHIHEGTQYHLGDLTITGNKNIPTQTILLQPTKRGPLPRLPMQPGQPFTPQGYQQNTQTIIDTYEQHGYLSPQNQGNTTITPQQKPNTQNNTINLHYQIQEGHKNHVEKIIIQGNTKTKDKVIRRELAIQPGEPFNMLAAQLSKTRLQGLQYFDTIDLSVQPTDIPNRKNLTIKITEREQGTGNFIIGAGFNSVENLVGFAELTQGNFDIAKPPLFQGAGQKLRLRAQFGTQRQDYLITFIEPWLFERKLELQTSLYHREFNFLSSLFDESRTGIQIGLRQTLFNSDHLIGGINYTIEQIGINLNQNYAYTETVHPRAPHYQPIDDELERILANNPDYQFSKEINKELDLFHQEQGDRLVSKAGISLAYDTRGGGLLPNTGQLTRLRAQLAGGPFGADTDFYSLELATKYYFPGLAQGHILELQGEIGVIQEYANTPRVPLFDSHFLGGLYTLRGYDYREVGPLDSQFNEPLGGRTRWFASAEYTVPIIERFRLALFYDIGMIYQDAFSFDTNFQYYERVRIGNNTRLINTPRTGKTQPYNDNIGIGMRLNLPIGPLRLDYGIPLTSDPANDKGGQFNFGVGWERPF